MLYQDYRPRQFKAVVGQGVTPEVLRKQVEKGTIGHSYLLTGNRGSGKTTTARIMTQAINCTNSKNGEPCGECDNCKAFLNGTHVDVIEVDAASNNGVDNVRNLINDMQYAPQMGKYKVYIIDEAHMLSPGASNAFLKTLEEPPKYVVVILATTDPQKLPITVLSRCQRFDFKRISMNVIEKRIVEVAKNESKEIEPSAANLIAKLADGAMRDALSLLEQTFSLGDKITYKGVSELLGIAKNDTLLELLGSIISQDTLKALECFSKIIESGKDLNIFFQEYLKVNRNLLISKTNKENCKNLIIATDEEIEILKKYCKKISTEGVLRNIRVLQDLEKDIKYSSNANISFEMAIIKMCRNMENDIEGLYELLNKINKKLSSGQLVQAAVEGTSNEVVISDDMCEVANDEIPFTAYNKDNADDDDDATTEPYEDYDEQEEQYEEDEKDMGESCDEDDFLNEAIDKVITKLREVKRKDIANILDESEYELNGTILTIYVQDKENYEELKIVKSLLTEGFSRYLEEDVTLRLKIEN